MLQKIKTLIMVAMSAGVLLAPIGLAGTAGAAISGQLCEGANSAAGSTLGKSCGNAGGEGGGNTTVKDLASKIVNIFSLIVGAVAVIMIIYGGFRYITSGGSSDKVGNAKNTLIYAIVGLIVVALAQLIVHFVLNTTAQSTTNLQQ